MAKSKGEIMLGKAMRSRATKKRGMVAGAVQAYTGATKALQNVGKGIRAGVTNAVNTRVQEQKNYDSQVNSGNNSNYYATASTFKRKRAKRKAK